MDYIKVTFTLNPVIPEAREILTAQLGESGFESFVDTDNGFEAYIPSNLFSKNILDDLFVPFGNIKISTKTESIKEQNWNKTWEENFFNPIIIDNEVMIRGSFHHKKENIKYDIVIDPKMAFGTGHHETTSLMMKFILEEDMNGKRVLDMGCGTGILSILCSMRGASQVTGIDIEEWAYNNAIENCEKNNINNVKIIHGDAGSIETEPYDIILANINRNILLNDIGKYATSLKKDGKLILSGFYENDLNIINEEAKKHGLKNLFIKSDNNWVSSSYRKM
ncbi:MAG: 50S ribosomal protein L11 methyltransferase [Chlorobi bacterium]|nr:50S ribosomal protein L11 methyltransferase [Chlorobiota bacterium]